MMNTMVTAGEEHVVAGREALERHSWTEAFEHLSHADAAGDLSASDLEALAQAAHWVGELDVTLNALERAYSKYLDDGRPCRSAGIALHLARYYNDKLARSVAAGWRGRAERLLEKEPECVEQGYLAMFQAMLALGQGKIEQMHALAEQALEISERFADRDLWALSTHLLGRSLLAEGSVEEGLFLIDESTAAAVGGELTADITGTVYCWTISTCRDLADVKRAAEWTEAAKRWCERQSITGFPGICRIHRAEIMRLHGVWTDAEMEAVRASQELPAFSPRVAGLALGELGEIRLRMGNLAGAEEAFAQARELGHDGEPGVSYLRLYMGDPASALSGLEQSLDESWDKLSRARLLLPLVEIALAAGDPERAEEAATELESVAEEYGGTLFEACALQARGMVQLAQGDAPAAVRSLRRAVRLWHEIDAPYETAQVRVFLARAHRAAGDTGAASAELRVAQGVFERLGAARDLGVVVEELAGIARRRETAPGAETVRAFLFTDIVSSTTLIEAIGDEAWRNLVLWHDRTLQKIFAAHGGEEVEHRGDGYFVAFPSADAALECAVAIQRSLAEHRRSHGFSPKVRIGVHRAEAARTGDTYQGKGVHEAARISALAQGDEVLVSAETLEAASKSFAAGEPRAVSLKGIARPIQVRSVEWQ
jgi:class 3 adenylate cyclase/predicted negative regulator of RcsB-dependent stress response